MIYQQKWKARVWDKDGLNEYFPATVPGNVQRDYALYKGILQDIQFSNNVEKLEETESYTWEYRAELDFNSESDDRIFFTALGIDYRYDILLDGNKIFSHEGMYTIAEIDITEKVKTDSVIQVIIHPHPKMKGSYKRTRNEAADSCKPPVCYGWDWNPRLLISGFWLPAYIETRKMGYINNCEPKYVLNLEKRTAKVSFSFDCSETPFIEMRDPDGNIVYRGTKKEFEIKDVKLWWCNGQGEPNLYSWNVKSGSDEKFGTIGFKTIRLVLNPRIASGFPKDQDDAPMTFELNGRRIFAKGSNYVNPEIFNANTCYELNKSLVLAAKEANMNIFRIWGGAGLAKPEFYDLCDECGILIWQEFPLACNCYPNSEHYLSILEAEATSIIKNLRHHACLALWCGGNELFNAWSGMTDQSLPLRLLGKLCYELDKYTPFIMTSPRCGMGHGGYSFSDWEGNEVFKVFQESNKTAYSEFGVPGFAPLSQLKKIIPEDELFPITPTESWKCHHAFGAWGGPSWARLDTLDKYFGKINSIDETVRLSEWLQCEGYKAVFEEGRRQWPRCSVAINWCYNEPWITAAGNSIISYPDIKKPAYFAVKSSLRPVLATARIAKFSWQDNENLKIELWYHNDSCDTVSDTVNAVLEIGDKKYDLLSWNTGKVSPGSNKLGPIVNFTMPCVPDSQKFTVNLYTSENRSSNHYTLLYKCNKKQTNMIKQNNV